MEPPRYYTLVIEEMAATVPLEGRHVAWIALKQQLPDLVASPAPDGWQIQQREMTRLAAAPDFVVGRAHAITEPGQVLTASATGSQLGLYIYGVGKVIWVVGTQKIVPNLEENLRRIEGYSYPLEDAQARQAYGMGSMIGKVLIANREAQPQRITGILVKENLEL
jgi:hypothetical protein